MYIVSIAFIILLITKKYSTSIRIIYKRFTRVKNIIVFKLPKTTKEIISLY